MTSSAGQRLGGGQLVKSGGSHGPDLKMGKKHEGTGEADHV